MLTPVLFSSNITSNHSSSNNRMHSTRTSVNFHFNNITPNTSQIRVTNLLLSSITPIVISTIDTMKTNHQSNTNSSSNKKHSSICKSMATEATRSTSTVMEALR